MLRSEFEQRVNYKVTEEEFKSINEMYMDTDLDKDDFCLLYNASQFITQKVADVARERKQLREEKIQLGYWMADQFQKLGTMELRNKAVELLGKAGNDVQTLYFCINTELKKKYPYLKEYNLLTNIYICQALCTYVREKEMHYDQLIRMRLSAPYHSTVNKDALAVCKALQEIAGNYNISIHTRIINTAVKVIGIKIDNMNFNCD